MYNSIRYKLAGHHIKIALLLAIYAALFLHGCAVRPIPHAEFVKASLTKEVKKEGMSSSPSKDVDTFSANDPQAIMWLKLKELEGMHTLRWEWYDPKGNLYYNTGNYKINRDGLKRHSSTSWHKIAIKDDKAAKLSGRWMVKVFLDDKLVVRKEFEVSRIGDLHKFVSESSVKKVPSDRHKWALIIGVENYRKTATARYAENDARLMKDYLINFVGVPEENTITLINDMATKAELEMLIKDRLKGLLKKGDILYVYYSGHGVPVERTPYILPYDGDVENPALTAYPLDALYADLDQLPADNVYLFLDTCFSGRAGRAQSENLLIAGARPGVLVVKDPLLLSRKIVVMSASGANQLSNYYKEKKHGLFTYYLIKGLVGDADGNGDGRIQLGELSKFVEEEVSTVSRRLFGLARLQNPQVKPAPLGKKENLVLANVPE